MTNLEDIKQTVEGYPVKNLKWNPFDNILTGQVKCPVIGRENLFDGYVGVTWRRNGTYIDKGRGKRPDLKLDLTAYELK